MSPELDRPLNAPLPLAALTPGGDPVPWYFVALIAITLAGNGSCRATERR